MYIEQIYTSCLAEAAYYIESDGEAVIIDPIRETSPYREIAMKRGAKIKYVFETHFHADFVSGHIDLARETGAKIVFGPHAFPQYDTYQAIDGEIFDIGKLKIKVLHTPGHTLESSCFLLFDEQGKETAIFTGDTLFVGDVGRPDLLDGTMSKEEMAAMMYDSLNNKIKVLPDNVIVYPAHGPGSSCGKNIGKETWSTIGQQKNTNYALANIGKAEFVNMLTHGLSPAPAYFFSDARINKNGYDSLDNVMDRNNKALSVEEFSKEIELGVIILDTRINNVFEKGFIKGAINIGLDGTFAVWVGTIIDINKSIVIVADKGKEEESILRLARVGYEKVKGYLSGGIENWLKEGKQVEKISSINANEFAQKLGKGYKVLDVRKMSEVENGSVEGAIHISLNDLEKSFSSLDKNETYMIHCAGGYRSMIAGSILKAKGFSKLYNVYGGFSKIKETKVPIVSIAKV